MFAGAAADGSGSDFLRQGKIFARARRLSSVPQFDSQFFFRPGANHFLFDDRALIFFPEFTFLGICPFLILRDFAGPPVRVSGLVWRILAFFFFPGTLLLVCSRPFFLLVALSLS